MKPIARPLLLAALAFAPAIAAHAQPAPVAAPPAVAATMVGPTEKDRLGAQFVHLLMDAEGFDFERRLSEAVEFDQAFKAVTDRPEWPDMMRAAVAEEIRRDLPQIELVLARAQFADLSVAELSAGVDFAGTPGGRQIVAAVAKGRSVAEAARLSPMARKALAAMNATSDGRAFLAKLGAINGNLAPAVGLSVVRIILPRAMVAFAERARAAESLRPPQVSASPEADKLGGELAQVLFLVGDVRGTMKSSVDAFGVTFADARVPAEWTGLMRDALAEEFDDDIPIIEALFGRAIARHFTLDELRAGTALFNGPVGQHMVAALAAERAGKPRTSPSKADRMVIDAFMSTPAGSAFMHKLSTLDQIKPEESFREFLIVFLPRVMGRFGEKVLASQAAIAAVS